MKSDKSRVNSYSSDLFMERLRILGTLFELVQSLSTSMLCAFISYKLSE